ncbi:MAG: ATP-dependent DNA helicase RecG [Bacteroidetes bacterium]|nr:ATP-dependent DNA helicase RecG [Bacteroidota bacterium]
MNTNYLDTPIEYIKGVGPQRADALKTELHIFSAEDLIKHYPYRYVDRTKFYKVREINADIPYVQVMGKIIDMRTVGEKRAKRFIATLKDETGEVELVWFQGIRWIEEKIKYHTTYIIFGRPNIYNGKINLPHPEIEEKNEENTTLASAWQALYNTTEKLKFKGLDSKGVGRIIKTAVSGLATHPIEETIPKTIIQELKLLDISSALKNIHIPANADLLKHAEYRLKFEELFYVQLKLLRSKLIRQKTYAGFQFSKVGDYFNNFYNNHLPFPLTNAQKRVIKEIRVDMGSGKQMNRLLQGDVGSGKTLVALMTMLIALDNGFQACLIAPTEILAQQHFQTLSQLLQPMNIKIGLLIGSSKTKARKELHELLRNGEMHLLIGTHALLEDEVQFQNLGLVVIDEQHRFGVAQRAQMWKKNTQPPHVLVMTATPIPRTLAMTLYGDLDVSVIDEMPPGRKPIQTIHRFDSQRLKVFAFIKEEIQKGRQIYVVYPLIEESEKLDLKNLMEGYESMVREFPLPNYRISIVHGKMKPADKDFEMQRFVKGETQIMIATTVIEVGVNVPNASVMIIENAERFGLSQLHQLRGRVGRGAEKSYCILMSSYKLSTEAKTRIETMVRTVDGFEIAEVDLRLRGPGDISGTQQSGLVDLRLADLAKDAHILQQARNIASELLSTDPNLEKPEHKCVVINLKRLRKDRPNWSRIS